MKHVKLFESFRSDGYQEVEVSRYLYHRSAPVFRDLISDEGLIPQRGEQWLSDTRIDGEAVFATDSSDPKDLFDSGWDDDLWRIDTRDLDNRWYRDPNFLDYEDSRHVFTLDRVPVEAIELVYQGSGDSLDESRDQ
jgi:hypothetical protein